MKATEFRLGNLYEYFIQDDLDSRKEWWVLCQMEVESLKWVSEHPEDEDYRPIPLTEEWLLKFGFRLKDYSESKRSSFVDKDQFPIYDHGFVNMYINKSGSFFYVGSLLHVNLKYVHQLQNLFHALTGEELLLRSSANSAGNSLTN